jgi:hypothetical protein
MGVVPDGRELGCDRLFSASTSPVVGQAIGGGVARVAVQSASLAAATTANGVPPSNDGESYMVFAI